MEKECESIDRNVTEKDPPVIINNGQPKINTKVDASCNVLCIMHVIFVLWQCWHIVCTLVLWVCV